MKSNVVTSKVFRSVTDFTDLLVARSFFARSFFARSCLPTLQTLWTLRLFCGLHNFILWHHTHSLLRLRYPQASTPYGWHGSFLLDFIQSVPKLSAPQLLVKHGAIPQTTQSLPGPLYPYTSSLFLCHPEPAVLGVDYLDKK